MSEINEKYLPEETIVREGKLLASIGYVPNMAFLVCGIVGVLLCVTRLWGLVILGVFIVVLTVSVKVFVKDYKVLDIYDNNLILYDLDNTYARKINYDSIVEWACKHGTSSADAIMLKLNDEEVIYKDTFMIGKAYRVINKLMPEKESQAIKDKENAKTKLKFDIPFFKKKNRP